MMYLQAASEGAAVLPDLARGKAQVGQLLLKCVEQKSKSSSLVINKKKLSFLQIKVLAWHLRRPAVCREMKCIFKSYF
jgi:hypothetical protein